LGGAIGFAYSSGGLDDSTRTPSTQLSYSGRYDYDLQTENEELRSQLTTVRGQVDNLKKEREGLYSQIHLMDKEIALLKEQLRLRDKQLVWGEILRSSKKRDSFQVEGVVVSPSGSKRNSFEGDASSTASRKRRTSLVGRLFRRTSSKKLMMSDEDLPEELPNEVSVPSTRPATPTKSNSRRSLFKRMFSGKGKKLQSSSSELVSDDSATNKPQEEEPPQQPQQEEDDEGEKGRETIQYVDWKRDPLPTSPNLSDFSRVTMSGYMMNGILEQDPIKEEEEEYVQQLEWKREEPTPLDAIVSAKMKKNNTKEEEYVQYLQWYREHPTTTTHVLNIRWERVPPTPVLKIRWERIPACPVLNIQWERIPSSSSRNLVATAATQKEDQEQERVQVIDWYREQPATTDPVLSIRWERIPATPVLNIQWERIPATPVLNIQWERIPSRRNLGAATAAVEEERVHHDNVMQSPKSVLKSCLKSPSSSKKRSSSPFTAVVLSPEEMEAAAALSPRKRLMIRESINEVSEVQRIRGSAWDNCFFTEDELADFKYNAFLEECGLSDDDF